MMSDGANRYKKQTETWFMSLQSEPQAETSSKVLPPP
jgi:hypothetical protein